MKTATKALSSENSPTASMILALKATILRQMDDVADQLETDSAVHEAKMCIKHDLETR